MNSERVKELLAKAGAVREGHFVGTSGKHLSTYVAKDQATKFPSIASELCAGIAEHFASYDVDVVVAPAVGGLPLSQWIAHHLTRLRPDRPEVLALYVEPNDKELVVGGDGTTITIPGTGEVIHIAPGEKIIHRRLGLIFKRGFNVDVGGRRVLGAEDILTTGGSAANMVRAIAGPGGILVGVAVLVNGGQVTKETLEAPELFSLLNLERQVYTEAECLAHGLCHRQVPINTDFGHGAAFLARKAAESSPLGS